MHAYPRFSRKALFVAAAALLLPAFAGAAAPAASAATPLPPPAAAPAPEARRPLRAHFIDVGHGDCCLIQTPGGHNILIDGGYIDAADDVVRLLKGAGVARIALVIATHPHSDHIGGLPAVLGAFPVEMVLDSGKVHTTGSYEKFMKAVKDHPKVKYRLARAGQKYRVDDVTLDILSPREPLPADINDCSIICRLACGKTSIMFTGDAGVEAEKRVVRRGGVLRSNVLKVGHHGSSTSTSRVWLNAVAPRTAVISCRERESEPAAVRKLKARGVRIFRTDRDGTVLLESDGEHYTVRAEGALPAAAEGYASYPVPPEHEDAIIGNVRSNIYHLPGGKYYLKTSPANRRYFATESEARAAGFRRSGE